MKTLAPDYVSILKLHEIPKIRLERLLGSSGQNPFYGSAEGYSYLLLAAASVMLDVWVYPIQGQAGQSI